MQFVNLRHLLTLTLLSLAFPAFAKSSPIDQQDLPKKNIPQKTAKLPKKTTRIIVINHHGDKSNITHTHTLTSKQRHERSQHLAYLGAGPQPDDSTSSLTAQPETYDTSKLETHEKNNTEAKQKNHTEATQTKSTEAKKTSSAKTKTASKSEANEATKSTIKKTPKPKPAANKSASVKKRFFPSINLMQYSPQFYMGIDGGYGVINGAYQNDGQFTQGRLALGMQTAQNPSFAFGLEAGVQWGNEMRLSTSQPELDNAGGLLIQTTLKPLVDLLLTFKKQIIIKPLFVVLKGGIAYRQLQFMDRSSPQDNLRKVNGELQAGLSYNLDKHTALTIFYQGIYAGNNAGIYLDAENNVLMRRIPTQQAGFLGLEYSV